MALLTRFGPAQNDDEQRGELLGRRVTPHHPQHRLAGSPAGSFADCVSAQQTA